MFRPTYWHCGRCSYRNSWLDRECQAWWCQQRIEETYGVAPEKEKKG